MSETLKSILCVVLAMVMVLSLSACRHSPVLEQTVYSADGEVDPNNQQTDNDEEHSEEDTTLPPKTTKPDVSQQADQTRVSATKPRTSPQTRQNTGRNGQKSQKSTASPSNNQSNTNKGTGEVPGVSEDPNAPNKAVDRKAVNREDLPEDVATVAAVGDAALYVEMLGGANRLLASSASFTQNYFAQLFSDHSKVKGLWDRSGETAMTDAQFQQLLSTNPEAVFYIAYRDVDGFTVSQSFSEDQLIILNQKGIYTVSLALFNTTTNIKNNVKTIGKVLGKGSKVPGAKNANSVADDYIRWMDGIISGKESQTFSGVGKWNLDQDGDFGTQAETVDRYSDVGQYTLLIDGWDDSVSTSMEQGVAYAHTGYTHRVSPASYYLSIGGAANTAVQVSDSSVRDLPVTPMYQTTVYGDVNGGSKGKDYKQHMNSMTHFDGYYIGDKTFNTIIVDSQATKSHMESSESWKNWGYQPYGSENQMGYGRPNGDTMDFSNVHGDYRIVVNPYGIGSWTTGSPESPLETLWAEHLFLQGQDENYAFDSIRENVREFYASFYGVQLTDGDLDVIKAGV